MISFVLLKVGDNFTAIGKWYRTIAFFVRSQLPIVHEARFQSAMITHPLFPLKCSQIWICVSVSVSSSGTQCVTQFASGSAMIDWLFEFALSLNEDWGAVTIPQLHFTVHKRAGSPKSISYLIAVPRKGQQKALYTLLLTWWKWSDMTVQLSFKIHLLIQN